MEKRNISLVQIILTLIVIGSCQQLKADQKAEDISCEFDVQKLGDRFYYLLYKENNFDAASDLLESTKPCTDLYYRAFVIDLYGDLLRYSYTHTKNPSFAKKSEEFYKTALKLNSSHNYIIYWHLALLMQEQGYQAEAMNYVNKGLKLKPDNPTPLLATGLVLSEETEQWVQAREIMGILSKYNEGYYFSIPLLYSSVRTLCFYDEREIAMGLISNVEKQRINLEETDSLNLKRTKNILKNCEKI